MLDAMATKGTRERDADNTGPEYHEALYWWLFRLWVHHLREMPLLKDVAAEYDAIFEAESDDSKCEEGVTTAQLEEIRARFNSIPEEWLRSRFNGYRWRTTPPTLEEMERYNLTYEGNSMLDMVSVSADGPRCYAGRRAMNESSTGVELMFPAGTPRATVLAALVDLQAAVQRDWQKILDAEIEMAPEDEGR